MASRLKIFEVKNLFGLYSHTIPLRIDERITAIIGPNGRGKTACLKMVEALFRRDYWYFLTTTFSEVRFTFTEGEQIVIAQHPRSQESLGTSLINDAQSGFQPVTISFEAPGEELIRWNPLNVEQLTKRLRSGSSRIAPFLVPIEPGMFFDQRTGERLSLREVVQRHTDFFPPELISQVAKEEPESFKKLIADIDCHLIETQRLLVLPPANADGPAWNEYEAPPHRRRRFQSKLVVQEKAERLQAIIQAATTQYAALSQSRDRSFPRRVIQAPFVASLTQEDLRQKLDGLDQKRSELMSAGLLDTDTESVTIGQERIDASLIKVLEIYVQDNQEKLAVFDSLLGRINIFKNLVNARFIDKKLVIDRRQGFRVAAKSQNDVPLDKLSSGEQHQLVIVFDLLFDVKPDALILIDEPELSMHVVWQKNFINGLREMINLTSFDVVLATHSPFVVSRHPELMVELGNVDE